VNLAAHTDCLQENKGSASPLRSFDMPNGAFSHVRATIKASSLQSALIIVSSRLRANCQPIPSVRQNHLHGVLRDPAPANGAFPIRPQAECATLVLPGTQSPLLLLLGLVRRETGRQRYVGIERGRRSRTNAKRLAWKSAEKAILSTGNQHTALTWRLSLIGLPEHARSGKVGSYLSHGSLTP
jgi:hypothetical protein